MTLLGSKLQEWFTPGNVVSQMVQIGERTQTDKRTDGRTDDATKYIREFRI